MGMLQVYEALGTNKSQRFYRFIIILAILALVLCYGFYSKAISFKEVKVSESKTNKTTTTTEVEKR